MSQVTNLEVQNAAGAVVRADMNALLAALFSANSGATAPTDTSPFMIWADLTTNRLKIRNQADTAWITLPMSLTADTTIPDVLTVLENVAGRKLLRLGASGGEWQLDPAAAGSGATLRVGPEVASTFRPDLGMTINRTTGAIEVGTSATAGAADHLKVNGGLKALLHGFTCPDGSLLDTAGIIGVHHTEHNAGATYASTSWGVLTATLRLVITPQRASSRFLVIASMCGSCQGHGFWRIHREGSPLGLTAGAYEKAHGNLYAYNSRVPLTQSMAIYDAGTPGATVTYQIALRADSGTYPVILNSGYSYLGATYDMLGVCSLVALEIGGA
jgi:hypothetical protein